MFDFNSFVIGCTQSLALVGPVPSITWGYGYMGQQSYQENHNLLLEKILVRVQIGEPISLMLNFCLC